MYLLTVLYCTSHLQMPSVRKNPCTLTTPCSCLSSLSSNNFCKRLSPAQCSMIWLPGVLSGFGSVLAVKDHSWNGNFGWLYITYNDLLQSIVLFLVCRYHLMAYSRLHSRIKPVYHHVTDLKPLETKIKFCCAACALHFITIHLISPKGQDDGTECLD